MSVKVRVTSGQLGTLSLHGTPGEGRGEGEWEKVTALSGEDS